MRFMMTLACCFSASSLDCLAAVLASSLARSFVSLASWSEEMVRFAVCCSNASRSLVYIERGRRPAE